MKEQGNGSSIQEGDFLFVLPKMHLEQ